VPHPIPCRRIVVSSRSLASCLSCRLVSCRIVSVARLSSRTARVPSTPPRHPGQFLPRRSHTCSGGVVYAPPETPASTLWSGSTLAWSVICALSGSACTGVCDRGRGRGRGHDRGRRAAAARTTLSHHSSPISASPLALLRRDAAGSCMAYRHASTTLPGSPVMPTLFHASGTRWETESGAIPYLTLQLPHTRPFIHPLSAHPNYDVAVSFPDSPKRFLTNSQPNPSHPGRTATSIHSGHEHERLLDLCLHWVGSCVLGPVGPGSWVRGLGLGPLVRSRNTPMSGDPMTTTTTTTTTTTITTSFLPPPRPPFLPLFICLLGTIRTRPNFQFRFPRGLALIPTTRPQVVAASSSSLIASNHRGFPIYCFAHRRPVSSRVTLVPFFPSIPPGGVRCVSGYRVGVGVGVGSRAASAGTSHSSRRRLPPAACRLSHCSRSSSWFGPWVLLCPGMRYAPSHTQTLHPPPSSHILAPPNLGSLVATSVSRRL
jgi:hypothetical protein